MKLQPLLFDTGSVFGPPGLAMPSWGRWAHPSVHGITSNQPYRRLRDQPTVWANQEIPPDFWEPVVPNSGQQDSGIHEKCTRPENGKRSRTRSVPITIEHVSTNRSIRTASMYDDRDCDYNRTSDYDENRGYNHTECYAHSTPGVNSNNNGTRDRQITFTRSKAERSRTDDLRSRADDLRSWTDDHMSRADNLRSRTDDLRSWTDNHRSRADDHRSRTDDLRSRTEVVRSDVLSRSRCISDQVRRSERSCDDVVCTGVSRPTDHEKCADVQDMDAQIAASYGYELLNESDVELKVNLPKSSPVSPKNTTVLQKLRNLSPSNMYVILDDEEEQEIRSEGAMGKISTQSPVEKSDLPEILTSKGEFYDLCNQKNEEFRGHGLVVNLPPPKYDDVKDSPSQSKGRNIAAPPSYPAYNIIRRIITEIGGVVDYIRGDGNCFFRALSKVIYGVEDCHEEVRQAIVDIMEKFPKDFEQFIDNSSIADHFTEMRKDGTWATQAEIYGAASLLQRDIYILSPDHTGDQYRWLLFSPRLNCTKTDTYHTCHVTLCHTNGNHYDRIAPASGECNCGVAPPALNGSNVEIDLTSSCSDEVV